MKKIDELENALRRDYRSEGDNMTYFPKIHHRRSIRLQGYDYSQTGMYFVTFCTHNRKCLFGDVVDGAVVLNEYGKIAEEPILRDEDDDDRVL